MKTAIATAILCAMCVSFAWARPDFEPSLVSLTAQPGKQAGEIGVTITNNSEKPITFWMSRGGWIPNSALYGVDESNQKKAVYPPPNRNFSGSGSNVTIQPGKSETIRVTIPSEAMKPVYKTYILSVKFDTMGADFADAGTIYSAPFQIPAAAK